MGDKDEIIAGYEKKSQELMDYVHKLEADNAALKKELFDVEAQARNEKAELQSSLVAAKETIRRIEVEKLVLVKEREFWQRFSGAPQTYLRGDKCSCDVPQCCLHKLVA